MLNQCVVVGRIKEVYYNDNIIELNCPRQTPNESDIIPCRFSDNMKNNLKSYCDKGDIVGVKGRLISEGTTVFVQAEKVSFLSRNDMKGGEDNGSNE